MKTKGKLKGLADIVAFSGHDVQYSKNRTTMRIFHSAYASIESDHIDVKSAKEWNRKVSGTPKGFSTVHIYLRSYFDKWVTIGPKYNKDGSVNPYLCQVYGIRNPEFKAFVAFYEWFTDIQPIEHCNLGIARHAKVIKHRQTTVDVTRLTWDQLFEI
jgi:hypothetical protein